jgi:hypothetical protein
MYRLRAVLPRREDEAAAALDRFAVDAFLGTGDGAGDATVVRSTPRSARNGRLSLSYRPGADVSRSMICATIGWEHAAG